MSYKQECPVCEEQRSCGVGEKCPECQSVSAPPAPMGFNSAVIKPETRVNNGKVAECKTCEDTKEKTFETIKMKNGKAYIGKDSINCPDCQPEQPNQNLMIIEEIEGLLSQVNDKLNKIEVIFTTENPKPWQAKDLALEEIDLFQKTTLFELRKAFE